MYLYDENILECAQTVVIVSIFMILDIEVTLLINNCA